MWLDMNKIKNLKASWLFLQFENNADFVMFIFFYIYVIFHKEIKSTKKSKKNLLKFMRNINATTCEQLIKDKNILLLLCCLFSEAK